MFVLIDIATREVVHWNVTDHPTAEWTIQQFRNGVPPDATFRFVVHDRDAIFAPAVDDALASMSLLALRTPPRAPQGNAYCERFIGTVRRECLDWIIPLNGICAARWPSGSPITMPSDLIRRSALGCRTRRHSVPH